MPDAIGMPTAMEVDFEVHVHDPDTNTALGETLIAGYLSQVIADFQAPIGLHGAGGTGRRFVPLVATRLYDGNGYPELRVDDIVPGTSLVVKSFDTVLVDVLLAESGFGRGYNLLVRPQSSGQIMGASYGLSGVFPTGRQNISVTTTFGYAAMVPDNVRGAILNETARRILISQSIGLDGAGDKLKIGTFEVDTVTAAAVWNDSSVLPMLAATWKSTIAAYRATTVDKWKRVAAGQRMS